MATHVPQASPIVNICLGTPRLHWDILRGCASSDRDVEWSINSKAKPGHSVLFYMIRPMSALAVSGIVLSDPVKADPRKKWGRQSDADIGNLQVLARPIGLQELKRIFPEWGWLQSPILSTCVAGATARKLLALANRLPAETAPVVLPDEDEGAPPSYQCVVTRKLRNTARGEALKRHYQHHCQRCGIVIECPSGPYSEVHHLRPLGGKHKGRDTWNNMLVLCPNCHLSFDALAVGIDPSGRGMVNFNGAQTGRVRLKFIEGHSLDVKNVAYHWKQFAKEKTGQGSKRRSTAP